MPELPEVTTTVSGGVITVDFPAGVFSQNATVTISSCVIPASDTVAITVTTIGFQITDSLGLQPLKNVAITVDYSAYAGLASLAESRLAIARYDETNSRWIVLPSTRDSAHHKVSGVTNHFSRFAVVQLAAAVNLDNVKVYPNPYNPRKNALGFAFVNLTAEATIKIYTVTGQLVREVSYSSGDGRAMWDGKNDAGKEVASGIYVALIKGPSDTKKVKIAVEK